MSNRKATKRALLTSVMALALCVVMLVGTTFAWFTDTAKTSVNRIQAGNLDVDLEMWNGEKWVTAEGKTLSFLQKQGETQVQNAEILWEPGCTYELPELRVVNNGNLALKYKIQITGIKGDAELNRVIDWTMKVDGADYDMTAEHHLTAKVGETVDADIVTIKGHMQESAGNDYMSKTIEGIAITVVATQDTVEFDSVSDQYDALAEYPVLVVGEVKAEADTVLQDKPTDHNVKFTAPAGSLSDGVKNVSLHVVETTTPAAITVTSTESSKSLEVTLKDQNDNVLSAEGENLFTVELNIGKNRTDLKMYHDGALMTKDNGTLADIADHYVYDSATGYVTMKVSHFSPFTAVYAKGSWSDNAAESYATPVDETNKVVTIASAEELALFAKQVNDGTSYAKYTVTLTNDIDLGEHMWMPIGTSERAFQGIFDGNNHTISNLMINKKWNSDVGLFGLTKNGEIKNFTLNNADVTGYLDVGAVAGTPYTSKYTNIKLTGDVKVNGYAYVGGMLGKNAYANLTDLTIDVNAGSYVKANSGNYRTYIGGLVGFMGEGAQVVKNVTSNIDVIGSTCDVGGITGIAHYGNSFINCHSSGNVTLQSAPDAGFALEIGGIAGVWHDETKYTVTFEGCSFTGKLSSTNSTTGAVTEFENGGLVGRGYGSGTGTLIIN